jgi:hypothetical protein
MPVIAQNKVHTTEYCAARSQAFQRKKYANLIGKSDVLIEQSKFTDLEVAEGLRGLEAKAKKPPKKKLGRPKKG